jgi:hypothetical protein
MTDPLQPEAASDHARHDPSLIAALAARDADRDARDVAAAQDLVARCTACRDLLGDLVIIQGALPMASTPTRPRDFTLTDADSRRLRGSGWRRVLGFFGSARDAFSKPLAIGFTTIGIVALVVTAAPGISFGMASGPELSTVGAPVPGAGGAAPQAAASAAASEPSREVAGAVATSAPSAAASMAAAAPSASGTTFGPVANAAASSPPSSQGERSATVQPYATDGDTGGVFTGSNDTDDQAGDADAIEQLTDAAATPVRDGGPSLGLVIAGISLILGLGLFALRWTSGRLSES